MELIDRYIYAVTKKLPQSQQQDIAAELHGLIEDMLDERIGLEDSKDDHIEAVLLELGNPKDLANKYRDTTRYLIGPEQFDTYIFVLKIVLIVIGAAIGTQFVIQTILNPPSILDNFVELLTSLFTALPMAFAWTTFGFMFNQVSSSFQQKNLQYKNWHPTDLSPIPNKKRQIKRMDSIISIVFYSVFIAILIFSSEYFGVWVMNDGLTKVIPFLNEQTYGTYFLFITFIFGVGLLKECLKLISGKWTYKLAISTTLINATSIIAVLFIINGPDFWNPNFMSELVDAGLVTVGSDAFKVISTLWNQLTFWILVFMIVGLVWDAVNGFISARKK